MDNRPYKMYEVIANIMDNFNATAKTKMSSATCLNNRDPLKCVRDCNYGETNNNNNEIKIF